VTGADERRRSVILLTVPTSVRQPNTRVSRAWFGTTHDVYITFNDPAMWRVFCHTTHVDVRTTGHRSQ